MCLVNFERSKGGKKWWGLGQMPAEVAGVPPLNLGQCIGGILSFHLLQSKRREVCSGPFISKKCFQLNEDPSMMGMIQPETRGESCSIPLSVLILPSLCVSSCRPMSSLLALSSLSWPQHCTQHFCSQFPSTLSIVHPTVYCLCLALISAVCFCATHT